MFLDLKDIVDFQKSFQDRLVILDTVGRGSGVAARISCRKECVVIEGIRRTSRWKVAKVEDETAVVIGEEEGNNSFKKNGWSIILLFIRQLCSFLATTGRGACCSMRVKRLYVLSWQKKSDTIEPFKDLGVTFTSSELEGKYKISSRGKCRAVEGSREKSTCVLASGNLSIQDRRGTSGEKDGHKDSKA